MNIMQKLVLFALFFLASFSYAAEGMVVAKSPYSAKETMDRLEAVIKQRGMNVFLRLDHAAGAKKIGKSLRPTELIIFGNPQGGTPFMECAQSVGIDLPLKALVWEDMSSQVWIGYNDPDYIGKRHSVGTCSVIEGLRNALASIVDVTVAH